MKPEPVVTAPDPQPIVPPAAASVAVPPVSINEGFIRTWIAGYQYHPAILHPGDTIQAVREADNLHDSNAIVIRSAKGHTAGYLPRYDAVYLAPLLDQGLIQIDARLLFQPVTDGGQIAIVVRVRFTAAGLAMVEPDPAPTPAALVHNLFASAWRDFPRFNPGPLQQLRELLRPMAHDCALKPATKLFYRLLKEPLAVGIGAEPPPNPFLANSGKP
jgi:hypothetical protein